MNAQQEAAAILGYYFQQLAAQAGKSWNLRNQQDIERACGLLGQVDTAPELDSIPPYELPIVSDRVTQVFERDVVAEAADLARAGRQRYAEAEEVPVRRMFRREERRR